MDETNGRQEETREAVFQRVWKRVMEGREDLCQGLTLPNLPPEDPGEGPGSPQEEKPPVAVLPAPCPPEAREPQSDFPPTCAFLGENCMDCVPTLQLLIRRALADGQEYQALARRVGGSQGKTFAALSAEKKHQAKRLSAAYFLIAGARYWPEGGKMPPVTSYLGALRRRFQGEQETMGMYLAAAEGTTDPLLGQLLTDLAREDWDHACKVRAAVEAL